MAERQDRVRRAGTGRSSSSTVLAVCAALAAAVCLLYAQTTRHEFVSLDDHAFIVDNRPVRSGLTWEAVGWAFTTVQPNWHPVTWLSHQLDCTLFGLRPGAHHAVSAALHAANAVLLVLALTAMTGALWPSALVAALFALHPLRAESVAWLAERKDVLSGLFWILTILAYWWYARRPTLARGLPVVLSLALGLMAKTMLVSLPLILLLLDVWPLGRWRPDWIDRRGAPPVALPAVAPSRLLLEKLPLLALSAWASVMSIHAQRSVAGVRSLDQVPLAWRVANAPLAAVGYLRQSLWPSDLAAIYPHPALLPGAHVSAVLWAAAGAALALLAITALCLTAARRRPYLAVGWLWYLISLLPVIGVVQIGAQSMADRYTYLPMIGVYVMLAWGLRDLAAVAPRWRPAIVAGSLAALAALAVVSWRQIATWQTSETLYRRALAVTRDNYLAHAFLGAVLRGQNRADEAAEHLTAALRIRPGEAFTQMQMGTLLQDQGRLDEAARHHEEALRLSPSYAQAHANLGVVRLRQDRLAEAEAHLRAALQLKPGYALAQTNLGAALLKQRRWDEAVPVLQSAVALDPGSADAHNNLGVALIRVGRLPEAAAQFEAALRLKPEHVNARNNLAYVRQQLGTN